MTTHGTVEGPDSATPAGPAAWVKVDPGGLEVGRVTTVVAAGRALCLTRTEAGYGALDNHCPHQGGPLGDGQIADGYVICPWHAYEYDPATGKPPPGFSDGAVAYPVEERTDGLYVEVPVAEERVSLMDQLVDVLCDWGLDTVFGMVGHSNLGLADALRKAEEDGRIVYVGIRHEGAAAFAASGFAKVSGRPAACLTIAGPGATNLLTGLWDAKVDRAPIVALTGQVKSQVIGPGTFQEVDLASAFAPVAEWSQTVLRPENATELAALAMKHAVVNRDVAHLIFPDEVQELPGVERPVPRPRAGRVAPYRIAPPEDELGRAVELLSAAKRPVIIVGNGARGCGDDVLALAERLDAPVVTTFKAKGLVPDDHPLACGVLGRSGIPVASIHMGRSDCLLVLGASFSDHTGIATYVPTIQVDFDRMTLGKFHPVDVALWGEIGRTLELLGAAVPAAEHPEQRESVARQWRRWRAEKDARSVLADGRGRMHPALVFKHLSEVVPEDAVIPVDVGNNTYSFGRYFETKRGQTVVMSGYLGSIGFGFPAAMGAWAATRGTGRKVVSVSGDGGMGQYLAEVTTAVRHRMPITHVLLNNDELGKITKEQVGALRPVWQTALVNPDFAAYARLCGAAGFRVERPDDLRPALEEALAVEDGPALVEVVTSARDV
ncbi:MAG TPA: thiamine pyrophosphate-dependent enzyme [Acidimicrobiales bacterium]|nr:thiamine pyrophosphate-dependent enzyme [Acidimicrobiales bacterium]